jgi:cyclopropane fatty-acyl-phospholipid synthase-like methyltransferase
MADTPDKPHQPEASSDSKEAISAISAIAYGFLGSQALFSALRLGLFTTLADTPCTIPQLATKLNVPPEPLTVLVTTCLTLKLLEWDGEYCRNTPAATRYLVKSSRTYIGDYYLRQIKQTMFDSSNQIHSILEGQVQATPTYASFLEDRERAEEFIRGQHAGSTSPAALLARSLDFSNYKNLLDLGGGSGAFAMELVKRHPELNAIVFDQPQVVAIAEKIIREAGLSERIKCAGGDLLIDPWPGQADLVLLSYIASCYHLQTVEALLTRIYHHLPEGGELVLHDFVFYPDRRGPHNTALLLFGQLAISAQTQAYTTDELSQAMEKAGFKVVAVQPLLPDLTFLLRGIKVS